MPKYKIEKSKVVIIESDFNGRINMSDDSEIESSKQKKSENSSKTINFTDLTIPYSHQLITVISEIFSSVYQKEIKAGVSEANSKTLEFLRTKLHDLNTENRKIHWLDIGCGDGRCLEVFEKIHSHENFRYHGIDGSHKHLYKAEKRAKKYGVNATFEKMNAVAMKVISKYDIVSTVLTLHEVDPLDLPNILKNSLQSMKKKGTLVISDFQEPYEQEKKVVVWDDSDIRYLLEDIIGARTSFEIKKAEKFPEEFGFYCCYVGNPDFDENKFNEFMQQYADFLEEKLERSKKKREELESQIESRVLELLSCSEIDRKNISEEDWRKILTEIGEVYGIKAQKVGILSNQIEFLYDKIHEFRERNGNNN